MRRQSDEHSSTPFVLRLVNPAVPDFIIYLFKNNFLHGENQADEKKVTIEVLV